MSNQERIKEYLVGKKGYLRNDLSNGKVIMLSGKWGSGKTHFWQNQIASDILKKELKDKREVYTYVSLYGKSSIEEIENDIFSQAYSSAIGGENFITKGFATFTKRMKRFGSSKIANGLKDEQKDNIERTALSRLNNGGIICFDDFERKSKDIDLNDLFGFITQLTLNFQCKIVIILNDDVFEGEEKNIFSNVKEKTVSKFLKYEPSIEELFNSIFNNDDKYKKLDEQKEIILKTIEETEELNARIYFQVLDNLLEWIDNKKEENNATLRCLILVNILFITFHKIVRLEGHEEVSAGVNLSSDKIEYTLSERFTIIGIPQKLIRLCKSRVPKDKIYSKEYPLIEETKYKVSNEDEKELLTKYPLEFKVLNFAYTLDISKNIDDKKFQRINNFIETGILIDE